MSARRSASSEAETRTPKSRVVAWALWDWATQPFNSVIITFVFVSLYLVRDDFIDPDIRALGEGNELYDAALAHLDTQMGVAVFIAGFAVAILAPVIGQRADAGGKRKKWLAASTIIMTLTMFGLFFVEADPRYFWLGAGLIAVGALFNEIGGVNYNAMLAQVSTPRTYGRVSGLGWGLGYIGGIVALIVVVFLDLNSWFGLDTSNGMAFRLIGVGAAVWTLVFAWPVFAYVPEVEGNKKRDSVSLLDSYKILWKDIQKLWDKSRTTVWFLISSAIYRDGLQGIFVFGAVIAAKLFGFSDSEVIMFGIAANLIAGVSTIASGALDDKFGPRALVIFSLVGVLVSGGIVAGMADSGPMVFWIAGLALTAFIGPAQSASRSFLARVAPKGQESELFGLYATSGRAASFLAPGAWALAIGLSGTQVWGIVAVLVIVAAGLALLIATVEDKR